MSLYTKADGVFTPMSDEQEAAIRAAVVPDGSGGPLLYNDSGYDLVHTDEEAAAIRAAWAANAPNPKAEANAEAKANAQTALDASDVTILRCVEVGVSVPAAWATYRKALRAVISDPTQPFPVKPPYPVGT